MMMTRLVLGNTIAGGLSLFSMPLAFASLLALRYSELARAADNGHAAEVLTNAAALTQAAPSSVESLAAHRERKRASAAATRRPEAA